MTDVLKSAHFDAAAELLSDAFFDNPAHEYILPEETSRAVRLRWLLRRNLPIQAELGQSFCIVSGHRVDAMAFWHGPSAKSVGLSLMLRHGLVMAPIRLGVAATRRMIEVVAAVERQRVLAQGEAPTWYLNNMVVRKELRGSGVGSSLLGAQLAEVVDPSGYQSVLATQRPQNVEFYSRLGYRTVSEVRIGSGDFAFQNWTMVRAPAHETSVGGH